MTVNLRNLENRVGEYFYFAYFKAQTSLSSQNVIRGWFQLRGDALEHLGIFRWLFAIIGEILEYFDNL